jgi:hypothetical protein
LQSYCDDFMALLSCRGNNTVSLPVCRDLLVSPHTWCLLFHRVESDFISLRYLFQQLRQMGKSKCFYLRSLPLCSSPGGKGSQGQPKPKNALNLVYHPISFISDPSHWLLDSQSFINWDFNLNLSSEKLKF